ncbi:MAG: hypothetical protein A3C82_00030 [Candidatus Wildermuthbacteria bacterium RIFCSPHIGHO2_02_FULL_47_12]|uniref:Uncharacterized protein n=1 Tax=Candidatus Wildermuthbacteria bacterium RIFCSPHIGHO2_02_FULL_47_12 TaxID=1802451 RepID=A0A1G2R3J7_9BACT|nr:MAG: hypothetical protein A3C82_00030 [Candidatus Wildermuthbacteria bacterium RIFCSPHIGHO2_02_FULL_47_12]
MVYHAESNRGPWSKLSLAEQLGNVGSEVGRAAFFQNKDEARFRVCVDRALELFDMTMEDARWRGRLFEIARARELFCQAAAGENEYDTTLRDLERYLLPFAIEARKDF